ncbi:DUF4227 family protein [Cohnella fermenti]|uniref:DUF4227 family protein n=1 Tax=Cohnella fermenti TaxID=2565925 RepID=A0A4S4BM83_9BACL|nr:DUF4227 family protein [Cohnella fermenti]THF75847.1 DUF4227 family protein [Cohnella fermenti]
MREWSGKWIERLQFTLLFLVLTVMVHHVFGWMQGWVSPMDPYKVPDGSSAKVFLSGDPAGAIGAEAVKDRLKLFWELGE